MPGPFEGLGTILAEVLGASVIHRSAASGAEVTRKWHVRAYSESAFDGDGRAVETAAPELRIPRNQLTDVVAGDVIETEDGTRYRIGAKVQTPNPASDALVAFHLREIS